MSDKMEPYRMNDGRCFTDYRQSHEVDKQVKNIDQWTDEHPNYMDSERLQEEYLNLVRGCTSSIDSCKDKVIRKVCDNVYLTEK